MNGTDRLIKRAREIAARDRVSDGQALIKASKEDPGASNEYFAQFKEITSDALVASGSGSLMQLAHQISAEKNVELRDGIIEAIELMTKTGLRRTPPVPGAAVIATAVEKLMQSESLTRRQAIEKVTRMRPDLTRLYLSSDD